MCTILYNGTIFLCCNLKLFYPLWSGGVHPSARTTYLHLFHSAKRAHSDRFACVTVFWFVSNWWSMASGLPVQPNLGPNRNMWQLGFVKRTLSEKSCHSSPTWDTAQRAQLTHLRECPSLSELHPSLSFSERIMSNLNTLHLSWGIYAILTPRAGFTDRA